jgi:hypothetical protein
MSIQKIKENEVYKQVLADSFGGIMYNVDNQGKYDSAEVLAIWDSLSNSERSCADGIVKGAISFLQDKEV